MTTYTHQPPVSLLPYTAQTFTPAQLLSIAEKLAPGNSWRMCKTLEEQGFRVPPPPHYRIGRSYYLNKKPQSYCTKTHTYRAHQGFYLGTVCLLDTSHLVYAVLEKLVQEGLDVEPILVAVNRVCLLSPTVALHNAQFLTDLSDLAYTSLKLAHKEALDTLYKLTKPNCLREIQKDNLPYAHPAEMWVKADAKEIFEHLTEKLPYARFSVSRLPAVYQGEEMTHFNEDGSYYTPRNVFPERKDLSKYGEKVRLHYFKRKLRLLTQD